LLAALALAGCMNSPSATKASGVYSPGTYTASAQGFGGAVEVTVRVDSNRIQDVKISGPQETPGIGSRAIEELPAKIVAANGKVDGLSGASYTSAAIFEALEGALRQARGQAVSASAIAFKPGAYTGTAKGYNGDVSLKVTFSGNSITDIAIVASKETEHVGDSAYPILFAAIKEYTSTGVDGVSGATFTSRATLLAVEDAAKQAGCDVAALRRGAKPYKLSPGRRSRTPTTSSSWGAGGAGMAARRPPRQNGATVLVIEKGRRDGRNQLVSGGAFQAVQPSMVWDPKDPRPRRASTSPPARPWESTRAT
jgi:fumarate reductase flavoprotein subunit